MSKETKGQGANAALGGQKERLFIRPINCDQVAWILDIAERYLPNKINVGVSQQREMQKYAMLYEIMEVANLKFENDEARWNGTPNQARLYVREDV